MTLRASRPVLVVMLSTIVLLVAACGDAPDQAGPTETPAQTDAAAESDAGYNDADITFLQGMIPHHEQAVTMGEMVPDRTDRPELLAFAEDIIETQQAEITQMQTMLDEAGATDDHEGHDDMEEGDESDGMSDMDDMDMAGMMSEEQMTELMGLKDQEFDLLFIDMMIEHHQGAVDASEDVIQDGENPEVRALAEEILAAQQEEIDQMNEWREEWAGSAGE